MNAIWVDWTIFLQYVIRHFFLFNLEHWRGIDVFVSYIDRILASFVYCHFYVINEA